MPTSIPSSDATLIAIILLSCLFVILGILVFKRFHSIRCFLRRLLRTNTLSFHPSNSPSILPSFGPSKASPFYDSFRRTAASILNKLGLTEVHETEFDLVPSTPCCLTPSTLYCSTLGSPQTLLTDSSDTSSVVSSSAPSTPRDGSFIDYIDDKLPPNITIPIPRETPLDRMIDRWRKEAEKGGRARAPDGAHIVYPQISYTPGEVDDTPRIMVTLPSSNSAFPMRPSFAALLSSGPDKDPFFWDSIQPPRTRRFTADEPPNISSSSVKAENGDIPVDHAARQARRQGIHVFDRLVVPSCSGKHKTRGHRAPLGDSTNLHNDAKNSPKWI